MWIDISQTLSPHIPVWPNTSPFSISTTQIKNGKNSSFSFNAHTGTHIDAPSHFIPNGRNISDIGLSELIGRCQIIEIEARCIEPYMLPEITQNIVIFKTGPNSTTFDPEYSFISPVCAKFLLDQKVRVVGIDSWSVEDFYDKEFTTHLILLQHDIIIVEGLFLKNVCSGVYPIFIVPLNILNAEASPARVFLEY
jgi:arylformamidase